MAVGFPAKTDFATGEVLTATNMNDITGTLNLLQSTLYPAGRNKIINGDLSVNQRAFTSTTANGTYGFDRWLCQTSDGTTTFSAQTFTPGTAPVAGYEAANFVRIVSTGQTLASAQSRLTQRLEDCRTFAGQTVVVSFWAKASTGTPSVAVNLSQNFGSGGSATVNLSGQKTAITTSWVRYSKTFAIPSISGKTIGTSSHVNFNVWTSGGSDQNTSTDSLGIQSVTIDLWGFQVEAASTGSTASPFQTASGSIGGELALCQRYFNRQASGDVRIISVGAAASTTSARNIIPFPVEMRVVPSMAVSSGTHFSYVGVATCTGVTLDGSRTTTKAALVDGAITAGLVAAGAYSFVTSNASATLDFSAEL